MDMLAIQLFWFYHISLIGPLFVWRWAWWMNTWLVILESLLMFATPQSISLVSLISSFSLSPWIFPSLYNPKFLLIIYIHRSGSCQEKKKNSIDLSFGATHMKSTGGSVVELSRILLRFGCLRWTQEVMWRFSSYGEGWRGC